MKIITILDFNNKQVLVRSVPVEYEDDVDEAFYHFVEDLNLNGPDCQYIMTEGLNMDISI